MQTVSVQIGNSDDKLTQREWFAFVGSTRECIEDMATHVYFSGGSPSDASKQNYCFVFEIEDIKIGELREQLRAVRKVYRQDAVAWMQGCTQFL